MLHVRNLKVDRAGHTICAVPELDVGRGERVAVVGPNGSGKTTLLRVVGGLEREITGECRTRASIRERVYVHQSPCLFRGSVLGNARYALAARGVPRRDQIATARHWLNAFGVGHLAERRCQHLSAGERRRVALARAFAIQADLLLLDEPLADLDDAGIDMVCRAIHAASRATVLIASPVPLPATLPTRPFRLPVPAAQPE